MASAADPADSGNTSERKKILFLGESPVLPSAAAEIVRLIGNALKSSGIAGELQQVALNHSLAVAEPKWQIWPIGPELNDRNGELTFRQILSKFEPDVVFAFGRPGHVARACVPAAGHSHRLILYLKLDDFRLPPAVGSLLGKADVVVTMSECSREQVLEVVDIASAKVRVMYSPADTERFVPVSEEEKREMRESLLPEWMPRDAFVLGWVGLNRWRKQVWVLYKVIHYLRTGKYLLCGRCGKVSLFDWDPLTRSHADETKQVSESRPGYRFDVCAHCSSAEVSVAEPLRDVFLWMHMPLDDPASAWPAHYLEWEFGVKRNEDVFYTEGYSMKAALAPEDMPTLYQLWDGLLYLSGSEGFGLPAWEAMCTGIPVVYTNYSGHAEYLNQAEAALPVDGILQPERKSGYWRMVADVGEAIGAVRRLYYDRELGRRLGTNGRKFVEEYSVEKQGARWREIFESVLQWDVVAGKPSR
ncbi:MAG TPA: glycosyltransferase family 4 protein [Verrucomicrobiae bacterium]